ncbi:MAG: autotransporter outer membrane beta-barrel domain-containing protein, partial [Deltaproteobacteria bacterium]|nr:autotransporter outer membrane beta-barrel domain-containing protein [Deltaproteobacteria bacterium]
GYLDNNIFKSLKVNAGELLGGGLVGANSGWSSYLASVTNNYFDDLVIRVSGNLSGGGLMGARSSGPSASAASLSLLTSNMFDEISVNVAGDIFGAGLIGAAVLDGSPSSLASSLSLSQNFFGYNGQNIDVGGNSIYGGGLIGFYSANGSAFAQSIDSNDFNQNAMSTTNIQASGQLIGGGAIGATIGQNSKGIASIYSLTNNHLRDFDVIVNSSLIGGGLVGLVALGDGDANIQIVKDNLFFDNMITIDQFLQGGGVLGVRSNSIASLGSLTNNIFYGNIVMVGQYIDGGGAIGVTGPMAAKVKVAFGLSEINNTHFFENNIEANNGQIMGGLIYSYGLNAPLTIADSWFQDNEFTSSISNESAYAGLAPPAKVYGTVVIDTGLEPTKLNKINSIILKATAGHTLGFQRNKLIDTSPRQNSLYFGRIPDIYTGSDGKIHNQDDYARSDVNLSLQIETGGAIYLYDPLEVNQVNNNANWPDRTFSMEVLGSGDFVWGGANVFQTGTYNAALHATPNQIVLNSGTTTWLEREMTLEAVNHQFNLLTGGKLAVAGQNVLTIAGGSLKGQLQFNLLNAVVNDKSNPLLKIQSSSSIDISGAIVTLTNFDLNRALDQGEQFYLIDASMDNYLVGEAATEWVKVKNNHSGFFSGFYTLKIDKDDNSTATNRYLVAKLPVQTPTPLPDPATPPDQPTPPSSGGLPPGVLTPSPAPTPAPAPTPVDPSQKVPTPTVPDITTPTPTPSPTPEVYDPDRPIEEGKIVLEGRVASLALLSGVGNWLADHSFRAVDLGFSPNNSAPAAGENGRGDWLPFTGADAGVFWTRKGSKTKHVTFSFIAGLARRVTSSFILAGFVDGGLANYDINGHYGTFAGPEVEGSGSLKYIGGGLMAKKTFGSGFHVEASARAGQIRNKFSSSSLSLASGQILSYEFSAPYLAFHGGLGYEWSLSDGNSLSLLGRYFWTRQAGKSYRFVTGEVVDFQKDVSQKIRLGGRYNWLKSPRLAWYLGAAYELELNSQARGSYRGQPFNAPDIKGSTGIGEMGLKYRPKDDGPFSLEAGLQGHLGVRRGFSGGIRLDWEF